RKSTVFSIFLLIAHDGLGGCDCEFEIIQKRIQIHRNDVRSANGSEAFSIGEPSAGEIESAFSTSTQLPVDLSFLSSGFIRGLHIFFVTLLPRHVEVIPVAIEYRSIFHAHNSFE